MHRCGDWRNAGPWRRHARPAGRNRHAHRLSGQQPAALGRQLRDRGRRAPAPQPCHRGRQRRMHAARLRNRGPLRRRQGSRQAHDISAGARNQGLDRGRCQDHEHALGRRRCLPLCRCCAAESCDWWHQQPGRCQGRRAHGDHPVSAAPHEQHSDPERCLCGAQQLPARRRERDHGRQRRRRRCDHKGCQQQSAEPRSCAPRSCAARPARSRVRRGACLDGHARRHQVHCCCTQDPPLESVGARGRNLGTAQHHLCRRQHRGVPRCRCDPRGARRHAQVPEARRHPACGLRLHCEHVAAR
eukprot:comp20397_c0_seq1/m.40880 comp20397_c0_seq1/g.40880  ORF comp20397_c0_seq1/g.40880 comp20397_c0_seq1/m.40880 type:complete len:300 (+) comp20397_c0_seq1:733-1632(+)